MTNNTIRNLSDIERVVMRRVHTIHILRPFLSLGALSALVFVVALWGIGREVWVAHVFQNTPRGLFSESGYLVYAFAHTRLLVQVLTLVTLFSAFFVIQAVVVRPIATALAPRPSW